MPFLSIYVFLSLEDGIVMKRNIILKWTCMFMVFAIVSSCGVDIPKETQSSFETMTVKKSDIEVPVKYSAKMKGRADVTISPQHIERSHLGIYALPRRFDTGVPAQLLQNRPDIKLADLAMEEAFYNTQAARAAFFPSISLQGVAGWTNSAGSMVVNPGKILLNAVASLAQPIYAQGKLKANLKISQLTQEDLMNQYVQTVIEAGSEVNDALGDCQAAVEKHGYYQRQVAVLKDAYKGTHELMDNGKASYLEVLTAQETLLNAQLNEATNMYNGAMGIIALGGATR